MMNREDLKAACLRRLNESATEHPAGHQGKLAARYVLRGQGGEVMELMFEKGPKTPVNLWVAASRVGQLLEDNSLVHRLTPASVLNAVKGLNGKPIYGRHSALKPMRELAHADLVCFQITALTQFDRVINHLTG